MEIWKDIPEYEGIYQASNLGRIRSATGKTTFDFTHGERIWKSRVLRPKAQKNHGRGDLRVSLWKNGRQRDFLVARLVARTWCAGYKEGLTVNHIDGNYLNNSPENLEWISLNENVKHGFSTGLYSSIQKKIRLIDENDGYIDFPSMASASRYLGKNNGYLHNAIKRGMLIRDTYGNIYKVKLLS